MEKYLCDHQNLPAQLYRVQHGDTQVSYSHRGDLEATDTATIISSEELLIYFVENSFTWGSRVPNCLINLFSDKRHAENWAKKRHDRTGAECHIVAIDTSLLGDTCIYRLEELVERLGIEIPPAAAQHVTGAYMCLHRIPAVATAEIREEFDIEQERKRRITVTITQDGTITPENIQTVSFSFIEPAGITMSLDKKNDKLKHRGDAPPAKKGRSAYAPGTCIYPNGESSSKIVLSRCVIQYRDIIEKTTVSVSTYARTYVCIGIPSDYIGKITADAIRRSDLNLVPGPKIRTSEGMHWFNVNIDRLTNFDIWIVTENPTTTGFTGFHTTILDALKYFKKSITCNMECAISANQTTENRDTECDMGGEFTMSFRATAIFLQTMSHKIGPLLAESQTNATKEKSEPASHVTTDDALLQYALSQLTV